MVCPRCGSSLPAAGGRCSTCGIALEQAIVATGLLPIDTTGLPDGASFEARTTFGTGSATTAAPRALTGSAATLDPAALGVDVMSVAAEGPLTIGRFGPRYHIITLLGAGGMGAVYQAWDAELNVAVALKVIRGTKRRISPDVEKRFKHELLLARQVTHKHVVRIHDLGEISGVKYITMPYVQGADLASVLRRNGKMPVPHALRFARQIASGLQAAHEAGVVHRDLNPANIMIGADDNAQIMDFGISASADEVTEGIVGTPEYMAPEQGAGTVVDARADIYAFGLILYEMLTGPRPRASAQDRIGAMKKRFVDGLPAVNTTDATVPESLAAVVTRCLERDPPARYQTTAELVAALDALDDAGELVPIAARVSKRVLGAAAVLVLVLLGGTYFVGKRSAPVTPKAHEIVPVLIADFQNTTGDPSFDGAVEQTLAFALEGAPYITVFKTSDARSLAAQLAPDKSNRVTQEVGQLIARREGLKVLLAGTIDKRPVGYRVELRAIDPATAKPIARAAQDITGRDEVLPKVASMAAKVREALGESQTEMAKVAAAETVTAASLDAMQAYVRGQDLAMGNQFQPALHEYQRAVDLDPNFGRAYAGMAVVYATYLKQPDQAEIHYKAALKHLDRMTEREKYRTLGTYYLNVARNYEQAAENYRRLVERYPADNVGHGGLALAYLLLADVPNAVTEARKSLEIYPKSLFLRYNYAMYAMYAGDYATAIREAMQLQKDNPAFEYASLPLAVSKLAQGDAGGAREVYARLSGLSPFGASFAKLGQADLDMYFGRHRDAVAVLREGIAFDAREKITAEVLPQKQVAIAEAYLGLGQRRRAADAAREAARLSRHESTLFPAARVLLRANQEEQALQIASDLDNMLQRQTMAYARLIRGEIAIQRGRVGEGIEAFRDSQKRHNSWFSRFLLGKAYVEAGHYAEALAELDLCIKRRGEAGDAFFYDMPTLRYLPPVYYWLARAQEGSGVTTQAHQNYETFLKLGADADPRDPLAADARRRLAAG